MEPFYIHDGVGFHNPRQKPNIPNMKKVQKKKRSSTTYAKRIYRY